MVDFFDLAVFQQVARSRSMSKAAASLGMAQPSVSTRIRRLESELGAPLFRRLAHGVDLTEAGFRFLDYAQRSQALFEEGRAEVLSARGKNRVRVAAPASVAETLFPRLAPQLVKRGLDVWMSTNHSPQVLEMLLDARIDAGLCLAGPTMAGVTASPLKRMSIVCVARGDHPLAARGAQAIRLNEIGAHRLAIFEWSDEVEDLRERLAFARRSVVVGYAKVSPAEVARRLVVNGGVISFLPEIAVADELARGTLVELTVEGLPRYWWRLMVVQRNRKKPDAGAVALLDALVEAGMMARRRGKAAVGKTVRRQDQPSRDAASGGPEASRSLPP